MRASPSLDMTSTRNRDKFCLSLDSSSSSTSNNTARLNRWSEVVPPKTALTFAALWDPQEGMVTFSGAALLESESLSEASPHLDAFDDGDLSQLIAADRDVIPSSENTATLATFQDAFKAFLHNTPWDAMEEHFHTKSGESTSRYMQARASSTFDGLDIYTHDDHVRMKRSLQLSYIDLLDIETSFRTPSVYGRLRLKSDLMLDAHRAEQETEATCGGAQPCLTSRFSATTTSTSGDVDAAANAFQHMHPIEESTSTPIPTPELQCVSPAGQWAFLPPRRRLLRKRRPLESVITGATTSLPSTPLKAPPNTPASASPSSTLSPSATTFSSTTTLGDERPRRRLTRPPTTTSTVPSSPPAPPKSPRLKLRRVAFLPRRKSRQPSSDTDGWVCIDVTPVIRQRYVADPEDDEY